MSESTGAAPMDDADGADDVSGGDHAGKVNGVHDAGEVVKPGNPIDPTDSADTKLSTDPVPDQEEVEASDSPPMQEAYPSRPKARRSAVEKLGLFDSIYLAFENPVLKRELLTSLRSNKAFILQFFFLLALGTVVYFAWPVEDIARQNKLARMLFRIFGGGQLLLLSVLAPAFSASAMTIEKEKRCIDLLLTSPIRLGTILMGKYLSSVLFLLLLITSTAPIVSVCLWMQGIDPELIIGLYVLLISVAATFGMLGLTCSVFFHRTQTSLSISYLCVLPLAAILLFLAYSFEEFFTIQSSIWPASFLVGAAIIMYQACLKRLHRPFNPVFKAAEQEDISTQTGLVLVPDRFPDNLLAPQRTDELLSDGTNPIYQKEVRSEIFGQGTLFLRLIIQISMFLSVVFLAFLYMGKEFIFVDYLLVFTVLVTPAFAANTFTQERERRTLEMLMTSLISPAQMIFGKFIACMRLSVFMTALVGITLLFYLVVGKNPFEEKIMFFAIYLAIIGICLVFETALGMFASMLAKNSFQSMIITYTILLLLFGLPLIAKQLLVTFMKMDSQLVDQYCFSSPFMAAYSVAPKGENLEKIPVKIWPMFLGFYSFVSAALLGYMYTSFSSWSLRTLKEE